MMKSLEDDLSLTIVLRALKWVPRDPLVPKVVDEKIKLPFEGAVF